MENSVDFKLSKQEKKLMKRLYYIFGSQCLTYVSKLSLHFKMFQKGPYHHLMDKKDWCNQQNSWNRGHSDDVAWILFVTSYEECTLYKTKFLLKPRIIINCKII